MGQVSVREGEAVGLALRPDVDAVRLRLSPADWMWRTVRWAVTLAGEDRMTPLDELSLALPRAPPGLVRIWDGEFPVPGVVAFGWAGHGAVVITRAVAEQIAARYARDPEVVQEWWDRLLAHELQSTSPSTPSTPASGTTRTPHPSPPSGSAAARHRSGGLRKPHGSKMEAWWRGRLLVGDEMTVVARRELADGLEDRLERTAPPASATAQAQLLRAEPPGEPWHGMVTVRLNRLAELTPGTLIDSLLGLAAR